MRYGIRTHGMIYLSKTPSDLVERVVLDHGPMLDRGEIVPGGWARAVVPVNEEALDILRHDYEIVDVDSDNAHDMARAEWLKGL